MRIVLWDTRQLDVAKDFAGGFGVGQYAGRGGVRGLIVRRFYKRDYRPAALVYAYLGAIFRQQGHTVTYAEDDLPAGADIYVFHPSLITLGLERRAMEQIVTTSPQARIWVVGPVAYALPEAFDGLPVTLVRGEPEQLLHKFDEAWAAGAGTVNVGSVRELDTLPFPDWSLFAYRRFRIAYDFTQFPTGLIQQSRGCTFTCNYCPYIMIENATRFRSPESVAEEMRQGIERYGFRSFKFRDPLFGLDRRRVVRLAELIGQLPRKVEFSIEGRIDLLRPDTLKLLREVGLTSITVGIETPDETTLRHYKRAPVRDDKQRQFVATCRSLGIRTVAGFMVGFPEDTADSIRGVLRYARKVNPTFANFNVVTPYPGTEFFNQIKQQIADFDFTRYNVYTPVLKYQHLTTDEVAELHARCFVKYYFRWRYLRENGALVWPWLRWLGFRLPEPESETGSEPASAARPRLSVELPVVDGAAMRVDACHSNAASPPHAPSQVNSETTAPRP